MCTVQLPLFGEHIGGTRSTIGARLDAAPSLYGTGFCLQPVGIELAAAVIQMAALAYQSCLGNMRRDRQYQYKQGCSG